MLLVYRGPSGSIVESSDEYSDDFELKSKPPHFLQLWFLSLVNEYSAEFSLVAQVMFPVCVGTNEELVMRLLY